MVQLAILPPSCPLILSPGCSFPLYTLPIRILFQPYPTDFYLRSDQCTIVQSYWDKAGLKPNTSFLHITICRHNVFAQSKIYPCDIQMMISLPFYLVSIQICIIMLIPRIFCLSQVCVNSSYHLFCALSITSDQPRAGQKRTGRDFRSQSESPRNTRVEKDVEEGKRGKDHVDEPWGFSLRFQWKSSHEDTHGQREPGRGSDGKERHVAGY